MLFESFGKIARLSRPIVITEKIDGTNACIAIDERGGFYTGSRTRWITPEDDHFGFSRWAHENKDELLKLGPGRHFGEWWGAGIQRGYDMKEKRFSLFNTSRWSDERPSCCGVVPVLYAGVFSSLAVDGALYNLTYGGSLASPGFMRPEGVIIYHADANTYFKKTILKDEEHKGKVCATG